MSEQIQRLVEQATVATDQELYRLSQGIEGMPSRLDLFNQKFAELIVRECANKVKDFYQEDEFSCYNAAEEIKQHFGVE